MALKYFVLLACVGSVAFAQRQSARSSNLFDFDLTLDSPKETTTPVPILRYIDTQNNDGSYTYGYESGDGTYKIETRYATGEVKGKYGYYDDTGIFREVEYGADPKKGFMPSGDGLLAPEQPLAPATQAPFVAPTPRPTPRPAPRPQPAQEEQRDRRVVLRRRPRPQPQPQAEQKTESRFRNFDRISLPDQRRQNSRSDHPRITVIRRPAEEPESPAPRRRPAPARRPAPRPAPTQAPRRPVAQAAIPEQPRFAGPIAQPVTPDFGGHPAKNINLLTGSYTVSYGRR